MSGMDLFANAMALFWIGVQQVCLCCVKWAYEDLAQNRAFSLRRYAAIQGVLLFALALLAYDTLLGIDFVYGKFPSGAFFFYPHIRWNFLCAVMLALDALLVAYGWRIYRIYMSPAGKISSRASVCLADFALVAAFALFFGLYHAGMTQTALRHTLSLDAIRAMQLFFIKIANFFYAAFEGTAAVLLWKMYRRIRTEVPAHGRV